MISLDSNKGSAAKLSRRDQFVGDSARFASFCRLSCLDVPADFARGACVNRQRRTSSKPAYPRAYPRRLIINWQNSEQYLYGRLFWICNKVSRGQHKYSVPIQHTVFSHACKLAVTRVTSQYLWQQN